MAAEPDVSSPRKKRPGGTHLFLPANLDQRWFLKWLQGTHAWLGFAAAAGILVFVVSGFALDHDKQLKLKLASSDKENLTLVVPLQARRDHQALSAWLSNELALSHPLKSKVHQPGPARWNEQTVPQPRRFELAYKSPHELFKAEYIEGNGHLSVQRQRGNLFQMLNRLHRLEGVGPGWILFADLAALSFIVLSLTGILLWSKLHGARLLAVGLGVGSVLVGGVLVAQVMFPG